MAMTDLAALEALERDITHLTTHIQRQTAALHRLNLDIDAVEAIRDAVLFEKERFRQLLAEHDELQAELESKKDVLAPMHRAA
jgi:hypothetical protein